MNSIGLFVVVMLYLALLFLIAYWAEKSRSNFWVNNPYIYSLSLAVYCTAWTYYGSVGVAANKGLEYLAIYIGPITIIPVWIYINTKIVRIARVNKISSIADFISLRYGNSRSLGALVTGVCYLAIIPYIALQIKAISETFHLVSETPHSESLISDTSTYVVLLIAIFSGYYGTRYVDASEKRLGIISAVAVESFLKLIFFVVLGLFVVYGVFNGWEDLYSKASVLPDFEKKNSFSTLGNAFNWSVLSLISMSAIFLLPRQFHTAIVENRKESHIKTAIWLFPLYLLIFNFFIFPIAWGGKVLFLGQNVNPEFYSILIPQKFGNYVFSVIVFLGGLSACVSMIIISSIALSIMLSNNLIIPYGWIEKFKFNQTTDISKTIVSIRRISIFISIILAFIFYKYFILESSLFSVGMISFVMIAQLAPSFFGAVFWRRGSYHGAVAGLLMGIMICFVTLIIPQYYSASNPNFGFEDFKQNYAGIYEFIKAFQIPYLSHISQVFFYSLLFNGFLYALISTLSQQDYRERNFAEIYVDIDKYISNHENAFIWKGTAYVSDIEKVLVRFLGEKKTKQALKIFNSKYNVSDKNNTADARFIKFSENLLSGRIGTASAKILIEGVAQEEKISLTEVLRILEESQQNIVLNKKLTEQSQKLRQLSAELKTANENLIIKDYQKDEFLDSVAHELRTPITAIRAASEVIQEDDEMPIEIRKQFLENIISESDRLNDLINDLLDLDQLENTETVLNTKPKNIKQTLQTALKPLHHLIKKKNIDLEVEDFLTQTDFNYDEKRILQVFHNLMGNAIKFCDENGIISISLNNTENQLHISITNSGKPIPEDELEMIFDKFYQSKDQNIRKPLGSGLGLAICKKIIAAHGGAISAENFERGVMFSFQIPGKRIGEIVKL